MNCANVEFLEVLCDIAVKTEDMENPSKSSLTNEVSDFGTINSFEGLDGSSGSGMKKIKLDEDSTTTEFMLENPLASVADKDAIEFLQQRNIIPKEKLCTKGLHQMTICYKPSCAVIWRCRKKPCDSSQSVRKGTWLEGTTLPFQSIISFIYYWTKEFTSIKFCKDILNVGHSSTIDYNNYLREVCAETILKNLSKIGGPNCTVELHETLYGKRKSNRKGMLNEQWLFGGICQESREVFLYAVKEKSIDSLQTCLKDCVNAGTTIISDKWRRKNENKNLFDEMLKDISEFYMY